ncbi:hypothetical protein FPOAC2_07725 [Fusarium poae]
MEDSSDIRDRYDIVKQKTKVGCRLDSFPPLHQENRNHSGLDCLIVVLRRIYSCNLLEPGDMEEAMAKWLRGAENQNPIVHHAWHLFGNQPNEMERTNADRRRITEALSRLGVNSTWSFRSICDSTLMNETFWSQDVFRLTHPPQSAITGALIELSPDEIARMSIVELDLCKYPDTYLQEVVDNSFGRLVRRGEEMMLRPNEPWIVRVLYHASGNDGLPNIHDLKYLTLPIWKKRLGTPNLQFQVDGENAYYLMAVVRLRSDVPTDMVRTYNPTGSNHLPSYKTREIMSDDWSVEDGKQTYMLFFCNVAANLGQGLPDTHLYSEVAKREPVDEWWLQSFREVMEEATAMLEYTVPKPDEPVVNQPASRDSSLVAKRPHDTVEPDERTETQHPKRTCEDLKDSVGSSNTIDDDSWWESGFW